MAVTASRDQARSIIRRYRKVLKRDKYLYLIMLLPLAYYIIFHYWPMYGVTLAFKDFKVGLGILRSPWVGFKYFRQVLSNPYTFTIIRNTVLLRLWYLVLGFPAPIILALLLNEVNHEKFKRFVQSASYLPHFISVVVVAAMLINFLASDGPINSIIDLFGGQTYPWLQRPEWFRPIYTLSGIWQSTGWSSVLYLAALSGISPELYEAAVIDGANRWQRLLYITIPGITPTITVIFLLNMGRILTVSYQKVLLLYSGATYPTADVLGTYIYRRGILGADFSFATAVGVVQSLVGLVFIVGANALAKRVSDTSLW